jgi:DNA adenine methylase
VNHRGLLYFYQHAFGIDDHRRLAAALRDTQHFWVSSHDDCDEIRDLYSWACVEPIRVNYSITATKDKEAGERRSRTKTELLITKRQAQGVVRAYRQGLVARAA